MFVFWLCRHFAMVFDVWAQVLVYDVMWGFGADLGVDIDFGGSLSWMVSLLVFFMYRVYDFILGVPHIYDVLSCV